MGIQLGMATDLEKLFLLLCLFQVKHYLADFPLQRPYMLRKTVDGWAFVGPLALHCAVHAFFTLSIVVAVNPKLWWFSVVDFCIHFTMDRIKSGPRYLGRFNDVSRKPFWNALGFDQMIHHFTHYYIVYNLITS